MYIPEIDNHIYNIVLHPFYADIKYIDEYNLEQSELMILVQCTNLKQNN